VEKSFCSALIPPALHEDIKDIPVLVDGPPQLVVFTMDPQKDLIEMPRVAWSGSLAPELMGILLAKLRAPLTDRFVRHDNPTHEEQLFDASITEAEAKVQPHTVADDLGREAMVLVAVAKYIRQVWHTLRPLNKLTMPRADTHRLAYVLHHNLID
jgi:hypothetical protein